MLKTDPQNLWWELRSAEAYREKHIKTTRELQLRYSGFQHRDSLQRNADLENHAYEWLSLVGPRLVFDNPKVGVRARRPVTPVPLPNGQQIPLSDFAQALQEDLNEWIRDVDLRTILIDSMYDDAFGWGPTMTVGSPAPGFDPSEPQFTPAPPRVYRLSPEQYGIDPRAPSKSRARFEFHHTLRDREDLLAEARAFPELGWRPEAIGALKQEELAPVTIGPMTIRRGENSPAVRENSPVRDQVIYYEVWVPEVELDEAREQGGAKAGFHGTIYTLAGSEGESGAYIRDPRPYWGPPEGPYDMGGFYPVPDNPFKLSPLVATFQQSAELNAVAKAVSKGIERYKKIIFVDAENPKLGEEVASRPDLWVSVIDNFDQRAASQLEFGGVTNQQVAQLQIMRERLDRNSGISEARRGVVTGGSATEADIAEQAGETRLAFMQQMFRAKVRRILRKVAWFMANSLLEQPLFDLLDIDIEPLSMERLSEPMMQQRAMLELQMTQALAALAVQAPWVNGPALARSLGKAFSLPELEHRIDWQLAGLIAQAMLQGGEAEGGGGGAKGSPPQAKARPRELPGKRAGDRAAQQRGLTGSPRTGPTPTNKPRTS